LINDFMLGSKLGFLFSVMVVMFISSHLIPFKVFHVHRTERVLGLCFRASVLQFVL